MADFRASLQRLVGGFLVLGEPQFRQLEHHYRLLLQWNERINLSAIRDPEEVIERHFAESLFLATHAPSGSKNIVDIGSGGGFPGVPLAIMLPECPVTLMDSHSRKCVFLREVTRDLPNVRVLNHRLESASDRYDLVVSRGVSWPHMRKFLPRITGHLQLLSSATEWSEIQSDPGWRWQAPISLPWGQRRLLLDGECST